MPHESLALEAARSVAPRIRELAPEIERARELPREVVDALLAAGLFHLWVPRSLGGRESHPVDACQAVEEISAADGSTGWCVMLAAQSSAFAGFLPDEDAKSVFGDGGIVASTARPIGRAVRTAGPTEGFVVSGRWPFASGSGHATWFGGECVLYDGDQPKRDASGNELTRMLFMPRASVAIHDTWDTLGLRATASNDFSCEGVFVPASRGFQMLVTEPIHPWPLFGCFPLVFVTHGSQALGVARSAIETAVAIAATKPGWGGIPLREQPRLQEAVALATVVADSARYYLYATTGALWDALLAGESDTALLRARVRLATSYAVRASVQAVDIVHAAVGTSGIFTKSPLERQFRDVHTAAAHVMVSPMTFESAGRVELGLQPTFPFF
jgi:alkylation response protein AidB-like acyl-CoA dehydrogenase